MPIRHGTPVAYGERLMQTAPARAQRGYSLMELLVVVAIIGVLALITVPNFMEMYRSNQLKSSIRKFASDVRGARQKAATTSSLTRVTFDAASRPGQYTILQSPDQGANWNELARRSLTGGAYFENGTFTDTYASDGKPDIVFRSDGTADIPDPDKNAAATVNIRIETDFAKKSFQLSVQSTGKVTTQ